MELLVLYMMVAVVVFLVSSFGEIWWRVKINEESIDYVLETSLGFFEYDGSTLMAKLALSLGWLIIIPTMAVLGFTWLLCVGILKFITVTSLWLWGQKNT